MLDAPTYGIPKTPEAIYKVSPGMSSPAAISAISLSVEALTLTGNGNKGPVDLYQFGNTTGSNTRYYRIGTVKPDQVFQFPIPSSGRIDLNTVYFKAAEGDALQGSFTMADGQSPAITMIGSGGDLFPGNGMASGGSGNNLSTGTTGVFQIATLGHKSRLWTSGTVRKVALYIYETAGMKSVRIQVWRRMNAVASGGGQFRMVGQSENFAGKLQTLITNTVDLSEPIGGVRAGDYVALCVEMSTSTSSSFAYAESVSGITSTYYRPLAFPGVPKVPVALWEDTTQGFAALSIVLKMAVYMDSPTFCAIGDSKVAGHNTGLNFQSYVESGPAWGADNSFTKTLAAAYGRNYVNLGVGGETTTSIAARIATAIATKPEFIIINGGVNDLAASVSAGAKATFLANWTTMLDAVTAVGIRPIVNLIEPWTAGTLAQMQARDDWNTALTSLAAGYPTALVCNLDSVLGQNRSSANGTNPGNLWDQAYDDGGHVHDTDAGYIVKGNRMKVLLDAYLTAKSISL